MCSLEQRAGNTHDQNEQTLQIRDSKVKNPSGNVLSRIILTDTLSKKHWKISLLIVILEARYWTETLKNNRSEVDDTAKGGLAQL